MGFGLKVRARVRARVRLGVRVWIEFAVRLVDGAGELEKVLRLRLERHLVRS